MFKPLKQMLGGSDTRKQILIPVSGRVVPTSEVNDPTLNQEILDKGMAVVPFKGKVVAPVSGEVVIVLETKHAVSIRTEDDAELIIRIGLDTVNLGGEHFTAHMTQGDHVKAGDVLVEFDMEVIKEADYDVITPIVICSTPNFPNMICYTGMEVKALDSVIDS